MPNHQPSYTAGQLRMDARSEEFLARAGVAPRRLPLAFLATTSLTFLKPRLRRVLRPIAAQLADSGVTANHVTVASLVGSVVIGTVLCFFVAETWLFSILPVWLAVRTACATIDGTLAIEIAQNSQLVGILNEAWDGA